MSTDKCQLDIRHFIYKGRALQCHKRINVVYRTVSITLNIHIRQIKFLLVFLGYRSIKDFIQIKHFYESAPDKLGILVITFRNKGSPSHKISTVIYEKNESFSSTGRFLIV